MLRPVILYDTRHQLFTFRPILGRMSAISHESYRGASAQNHVCTLDHVTFRVLLLLSAKCYKY